MALLLVAIDRWLLPRFAGEKGRDMAQLSELPFVFWDERLSTVAAERTLIEMDFSRAKRAGKIDSAAAAFILQGVLDRLQSLDATDRTEPDPPRAA